VVRLFLTAQPDTRVRRAGSARASRHRGPDWRAGDGDHLWPHHQRRDPGLAARGQSDRWV